MNAQRTGSTRTISAVEPGVISFTFTGKWSAFDRGSADQLIPGIGKAQCDCTCKSFEILAKSGIPSHFIERVDDLTFHANEYEIPGKSLLSGKAAGTFIPLEWIWRGYLTSRLWARVKKGTIGATELGFPEGTVLEEGMKLPRLFLECSTKLEEIDRYLDDREAFLLSGLTPEQSPNAYALVDRGAVVTNLHYEKAGFWSYDGKVELGVRKDGEIVFVDGLGTPDENRLYSILNGKPYCKEYRRGYLKNLPWYEELEAAKLAFPKDKSKWPPYPILPPDIVEEDSFRYQEVARRYIEVPI